MRIIDRFPFQKDRKIEIDEFILSQKDVNGVSRDKKFYLFLKSKDPFNYGEKLTLHYNIELSDTFKPIRNPIKVTFHTERFEKV